MIHFSLLVLKLIVVASFDPAKIDYCNTFCGKYVSTACKCVHGKDRTYVTTKMQEFRQLMLDTHNDLRNKIARGDYLDYDLEPAANMHILEYDMELEHLARCLVMRPNFTHRHDKCRQVSFCESVSAPGQNIGGINSTKWNNEVLVDIITDEWYEEFGNIIDSDEEHNVADLIDKYHILSDDIKRFTQLIWATTEKIGCARAIIPKNVKYKFVLVCNYAGPADNCGGNVVGLPVYLVGRPCSKCWHTKCNKDFEGKYEALCGKEVKAPNESPAKLGVHKPINKSRRNIKNKLLVVSFAIFEVIKGI